VALPMAAGEERKLETGLMSVEEAHWLPDGVHFLAVGRQTDGQRCASVFDFGGGPPRLVVSRLDLRRVLVTSGNLSPVSPDGKVVAAAVASGKIMLIPLDGGAQRALAGSGPDDVPIQWTADGRGLFVFDPSKLPAKVTIIDLASGRRETWREIQPIDREGVLGIYSVAVNRDATSVAFSYPLFLSKLYLVKGLR
jgi:hypothetical protein